MHLFIYLIFAHFLMYIRRPFLIYDFATNPVCISLQMRKIPCFFISAEQFLAYTWK
jgi:hypothetical protein